MQKITVFQIYFMTFIKILTSKAINGPFIKKENKKRQNLAFCICNHLTFRVEML